MVGAIQDRFLAHFLSYRLYYFAQVLYIILIYNIPRACLLNRPPVPAMDLKSNRSGLWRHMLGTYRKLRRLCRKRSNNVARHYKISLKSILLSRDKNILSRDMIFMSRRSDVMLWLLHIQKLQYMHFQFAYFCSAATYEIIFGVVRYIIKHLFYETAWSILFWNHADDFIRLIKVHRKYSPAARILHTKFD